MSEEPKTAPMPDKDYSSFFHDPEFVKYPKVKLPAATFVAHEGGSLLSSRVKEYRLLFL